MYEMMCFTGPTKVVFTTKLKMPRTVVHFGYKITIQNMERRCQKVKTANGNLS